MTDNLFVALNVLSLNLSLLTLLPKTFYQVLHAMYLQTNKYQYNLNLVDFFQGNRELGRALQVLL